MVLYPWLRKCTIIGFFFLFVGISIISSTAQQTDGPSFLTSKGNWLYVGGNGPGNYTTIQDAVNDTNDGDTVFVYRGIYSHFFYPGDTLDYTCCVKINHSITLLGEDRYETIIDGPGRFDVISIQTNQVDISGFTIQYGGIPGTTAYGRGIHNPGFDNVNIYNNIIQNNFIGLFFYYDTENCSIFDNIIQGNKDGIAIEIAPKFVKVFHNIINNNTNGIILNYQVASCSVYENIILDNGIGIRINRVSENIVEYNQIEGNGVGVFAYNSKGIIQYNNFINNVKQADFDKDIILLELPFVLIYNQHWNSNYWNDWTMNTSRVIQGHVTISITFWIVHFPTPLPIEIEIGKLPSYQYDKDPAMEPYDIPI
jgi:parallel beta-helix repeat protein